MELEGTKTKANLIAAFAGESQASVKYQLYAHGCSLMLCVTDLFI